MMCVVCMCPLMLHPLNFDNIYIMQRMCNASGMGGLGTPLYYCYYYMQWNI